MNIGTADLRAMARATYWLATLYRRGEALPEGIGLDVAREAHELVARLGLRLDSAVVPWPFVGRMRLRARFADDAAARQHAELLGGELLEDYVEVTQ